MSASSLHVAHDLRAVTGGPDAQVSECRTVGLILCSPPRPLGIAACVARAAAKREARPSEYDRAIRRRPVAVTFVEVG